MKIHFRSCIRDMAVSNDGSGFDYIIIRIALQTIEVFILLASQIWYLYNKHCHFQYSFRNFADSCITTDAERFNCGWVGITENDCRSIGCCFNRDINGGVCYRKSKCIVDLSQDMTSRMCGWFGITSQQCVAEGCCENRYRHDGSIEHNTAWCIRPG